MDSLVSPGTLKALRLIPHFIVVAPTVVQTLQHMQLATRRGRPWQPSVLLALLGALEIGLVFEFTMNPPFYGDYSKLPSTNWGVWLHNGFTALQFTAYMLVSAYLGGKELWLFVGLTSYQASQVWHLYKTAHTGVEQIVMRGVRNPAFNAAAPLEGVPEWLEPISTPVHFAPVASYLDNSELGSAFAYFQKHWYSTMVSDLILLLGSVALLSTLKRSLNTSADRSAKLTMAFFVTFLTVSLMNSIPLFNTWASQWPASLTIPFITPAATPFLFNYVRPRLALLALALGVLVRSMIISHIAYGGDVVAPPEGVDAEEK